LKKVYILRGVSGSGKSSFVKKFLPKNVIIHSTDKFFYKGKRYVFNLKKLSFYHQKNFDNFLENLKKGKKVIVIDNTNLLCEFVRPYIETAKKYGYKVILVDFIPRGREFHYKRNIHNIPLKVISNQIKNYKKCKGKILVDKIVYKFVN